MLSKARNSTVWRSTAQPATHMLRNMPLASSPAPALCGRRGGLPGLPDIRCFGGDMNLQQQTCWNGSSSPAGSEQGGAADLWQAVCASSSHTDSPVCKVCWKCWQRPFRRQRAERHLQAASSQLCMSRQQGGSAGIQQQCNLSCGCYGCCAVPQQMGQAAQTPVRGRRMYAAW